MTPRTVLIVGAGLAGARTAETLRSEGYDGRLVLIGDEPLAPYERPALSKEFLLGTRDEHSLLLRKDSYWDDRSIELRLGTRVEHVDPFERVARTDRAPMSRSTSSCWQPARDRAGYRSTYPQACTSCGRSPTRRRSGRNSSPARISS